jgi:hypothetical protein
MPPSPTARSLRWAQTHFYNSGILPP